MNGDKWENVLYYKKPDYPAPWEPFEPAAHRDNDLSPKVLVLSHMYPRPGTQSGSFVLEQVKALRAEGVDARVVSCYRFWITRTIDLGVVGGALAACFVYRNFRKTHYEAEWRVLAGVPVLYLPYALVWNHKKLADNYRASVMSAISRIRDHFDFDIIHAHSSYPDSAAAMELGRMFDLPYVITEHLTAIGELGENPATREKTLAGLRGAARVIAVSAAQKDKIKSLVADDGGRRIDVIPNGFDADIFYPARQHDPDPEAPRFMCVGYLRAVKNLELLVSAFAKVHEALPAARLSLVGAGRASDKAYENRMRAHIEQLGLVESVALRQYIPFERRHKLGEIIRQEADIIVLSSALESFGCALMEAMACGKPTVSTRCGGPEDIITADFLGRLCENNDAEALAGAMLDAAENLRMFDPQRISVYATEHFSFKLVALGVIDIYESALREQSAS